MFSITEIAEWLRTTIPGIIVLGAIGSILGAFLIWVLIRVGRYLSNILKEFVTKFVGGNFARLIIIYIRQYFIFRSLMLQLENKGKVSSLAAIHMKVTSYKVISVILTFISFCVAYFLFLFFGTDYLKTSVLFVSIFFMSMHDAVLCQILQVLIERRMYGVEEDISKGSYKNETTLLLEAIGLLGEHIPKLKGLNPLLHKVEDNSDR